MPSREISAESININLIVPKLITLADRMPRHREVAIAGIPETAMPPKMKQVRGYKWLRYAEKDGRDGRI